MPLTNTPETLNILNPDFRMPEHCGGDRWSILHGDSLQILRQLEPNSFDAIITDPPYASGGSSQTTKNRSTSEKYSSMSKEKALPDFDSDQMDQLSWMFWTAAWLQDARRIAKPGAPVCLFIDWRQCWAAGAPPHCQARCARLLFHRLAALARHDAGFAVGRLDMARCSRVG